MNKRARHLIGALSLLAFLQPALAQDGSASRPLVVIDLRPDEERAGNGLAPLAGKCNKDVFRIADVATDPLKLDILKRDLEQALAISGEGKTLVVSQLVHLLQQAGQ
jgi:hypothetical protein